MKQYTFEATNRRTGRVEPIRATARTDAIARAHIVNYYADAFDIAETYSHIDPPHRVLGEIDCTDSGAEEFALDLIARGQS